MQVATINLDTIEKYDDSDIRSIIKDWGNRYCVMKAADELNVLDKEEYSLVSNSPPLCQSWAALWHRNGHDYVHRSKSQPFELDNRGKLAQQKPHTERLYKLLTTDGFRKQMKGNMLLYKAGATTKSSNQLNYPIRLTDGRYCFITGNQNLVERRAADNPNKYFSDDADILFKLWMVENVGSISDKKYSTPKSKNAYFSEEPPHINAMADRHQTSEYRRRCWKIYMLLNYYDEETWKDEFDTLNANQDESMRSGFIIWQRGDIIKHWERGSMPHPRF